MPQRRLFALVNQMNMNQRHRADRWLVLLAFSAIYIIWGTTYLVILIGLEAFPPFLIASLRFTLAGMILLGWRFFQREPLASVQAIRKNSLLVSTFSVELTHFSWSEVGWKSWGAVIYLAIAGSIVAFVAYNWLLTQKPSAISSAFFSYHMSSPSWV